MTTISADPFGTFTPTPLQTALRHLGHKLAHNYVGRKSASLILGPAGGRRKIPRDVTIFGTQRARLHPFDNICEKRVYLTPQHWDPVEREYLRRAIEKNTRPPFRFLDIGANAGLYSLFAKSVADRLNCPFDAICVEPDETMIERLTFNINASHATDQIHIVKAAIADFDGTLPFKSEANSRGLNRIDPHGNQEISCKMLSTVIADRQIKYIDAMKIDIEGYEYPALKSFFDTVEKPLWPGLAIVEISHEKNTQTASMLFKNANYRLLVQTRMNAVFTRSEE